MELVRTSGKSIKQIADELGVYDSHPGVTQDRIDHGKRESLGTQDRARLRELETENTVTNSTHR